MLAIQFMDSEQQNAHMEAEELTFDDVLDGIEAIYINKRDNDEWAPSKNVRDSKAPPSKFGAHLAEKMTFADVMTLMQSGLAKKEKPCHHCGKLSHWKRECPDLKDVKQSNSKRSQHQSGQRRQQTKRKSWKLIPPNPGQSQTKQSATDRTFYWCATCKHWMASHGTDGHKGKSDKGKGKDKDNGNNEANLCLVPDPSFWLAEFQTESAFGIPSILLAMLVGALLTFLAVGDVASIWRLFVDLWLTYGTTILEKDICCGCQVLRFSGLCYSSG